VESENTLTRIVFDQRKLRQCVLKTEMKGESSEIISRMIDVEMVIDVIWVVMAMMEEEIITIIMDVAQIMIEKSVKTVHEYAVQST